MHVCRAARPVARHVRAEPTAGSFVFPQNPDGSPLSTARWRPPPVVTVLVAARRLLYPSFIKQPDLAQCLQET